jgi:tyrosine decarboxylase/aspartate 1-decarboxylase
MLPENNKTSLFPEHGQSRAAVKRQIEALCAADHSYHDGSVFNSISTQPLPVSEEVFSRYLAANMGDNRIFPSLHEVEGRITAMLGELLGHRSAQGVAVSGGTEANLLAIVAALGRFRRHNKCKPQILAPQSVHFSVEKIARILDVELAKANLDSQYRVDVDLLKRRVCERTAVVVVTAGTSECGAIDNVAAVAEITRNAGIPLHVDAATGGFLIPFARELGYNLPRFDFTIPGVSSITVDPHKYGFAPIPAGHLLVRDRDLFSELDFESHYQGTFNHSSLLGTRPGAGILAAYAALTHLGRNGYRDAVRRLFQARDQFIEDLRRHGLELAYQPELTIVGIRLPSPESALAYLQTRKLIVSVSKRHQFLRIVVQRHLAVRDYRRLIVHLKKYLQRESPRNESHVRFNQQAQVIPAGAANRNGHGGDTVAGQGPSGALHGPDVRNGRRGSGAAQRGRVPAGRGRHLHPQRGLVEHAGAGHLHTAGARSC